MAGPRRTLLEQREIWRAGAEQADLLDRQLATRRTVDERLREAQRLMRIGEKLKAAGARRTQ